MTLLLGPESSGALRADEAPHEALSGQGPFARGNRPPGDRVATAGVANHSPTPCESTSATSDLSLARLGLRIIPAIQPSGRARQDT